ncbi:unnamed protein product [Moneuplotes crassus]|uniref:E1 ubiquitin-activating enzyme n=1 Tax=Euplotes crassus TaxID=5936 RepID=A0AAD1XK39_EUPCR|nr:unnamed protein product [Moneuplotes crassus]
MGDYDENLVSRQLGVYGKETMGKLANMRVLIVGMRGLGAEVAKNLILAGPKRVDIYDPHKAHIRDLSSNFYISERSVLRRRRDIASLKRLAELNSYVKVRVLDEDEEDDSEIDSDDDLIRQSDEDSEEESGSGDENEASEESDADSKEESQELSGGESDKESEEEKFEEEKSEEADEAEGEASEAGEGEEEASEEDSEEENILLQEETILKYHVIVVTEIFENIEVMMELNEKCRDLKRGFILAQSLGAYGYCFVDFGEKFKCLDRTGEESKSYNIVGITKAKKAELTVYKGKPHDFGDGDHVKFSEVKGMEELNELEEPVKIRVIDKYTIELDLDTRDFEDYEIDGIISSVNVPEKIEFQNLRDSLNNPLKVGQGFFTQVDLANFGRAEQLHIGLQAILGYQLKNGRLPKNKRKEVHEVVKLSQEANKALKKLNGAFSVDKIDAGVVKLMAKFARNQITPMTSMFGGIVCQEVVKFTGKFAPLEGQWLHYDMFSALPRKHKLNRKHANSRYDDQIAIFGREFQKEIEKQKTFLVGAGALGCELLKCFALMGLGCSNKGLVAVTDNDHIELSNLNRQFLFRNRHIGKAKSTTACKEATKINKDLNTKPYSNLVSPDTENIFNDKFWESQNYIVNAVDNRKARLYIDSKCVWYKRALFDSGTLGTKANTQVVLPDLTECYGDHQDPEEESIPMCTLRNFPNQIEHCIEWARNRFGELFTDKPTNLRSFLTDREGYIEKIKKDGFDSNTLKDLKTIKDIGELSTFEECVGFAKQKFYEDYELQVNKLIELFPEDHKDSTGAPFWSGPKRFPEPIPFDAEDELHLDYIIACANLIAETLGIDQNEDKDDIARMAEEAEVEEDAFAAEIDVEGDEEAKKAAGKPEKKKPEESKEQADEIIEDLEELEDKEADDINPAEFEKDDDTNFHIDFIHAAANLRARNYKMEECDHFRSKMIAGKIIPAIATTTATIVGILCIEILKYIQKFKKISDYRNTYLNTGIGTYLQNEPGEPKKTVDVEEDPIMLTAVKACPPNWTIWDTIEIEGPLTVKNFNKEIAKVAKKHKMKVEVDMVAYGEKQFYSDTYKSDKKKERLEQTIEELYEQVIGKDLDQKAIRLEVSAANSDGDCVSMPAIKYIVG